MPYVSMPIIALIPPFFAFIFFHCKKTIKNECNQLTILIVRTYAIIEHYLYALQFSTQSYRCWILRVKKREWKERKCLD